MTTIPQQNNSAPVVEGQTITPKLYQVGDIARLAQCSASWVRNVTDDLRLETLRLSNLSRVYTERQAAALINEIQRRRTEALK